MPSLFSNSATTPSSPPALYRLRLNCCKLESTMAPMHHPHLSAVARHFGLERTRKHHFGDAVAPSSLKLRSGNPARLQVFRRKIKGMIPRRALVCEAITSDSVLPVPDLEVQEHP